MPVERGPARFQVLVPRVVAAVNRHVAGDHEYDVVLMFKILVLQHLYNVCDDDIEYQIRDRHSFCRF